MVFPSSEICLPIHFDLGRIKDSLLGFADGLLIGCIDINLLKFLKVVEIIFLNRRFINSIYMFVSFKLKKTNELPF